MGDFKPISEIHSILKADTEDESMVKSFFRNKVGDYGNPRGTDQGRKIMFLEVSYGAEKGQYVGVACKPNGKKP